MEGLSVLTLNIWGLWLVSKKREERVGYLAEYLKSCTEDVVLLQEVWVDEDAQLLIRAGKAGGLAHCTHFRCGVFGSGLVTLSRHPIIRHAFWRYAAAGFATSITCGDFYAGKGVGWVRLATPFGEVDVFNTHLHANYCHDYREPPPDLARAAVAAAAALTGSSELVAAAAAAAGTGGSRGRTVPAWVGGRIPDDDDAALRIGQLLELTEIITLVTGSSSSRSSRSSSSGNGPDSCGSGSSSSRLLVLGGDLNCKPDTLEVDLFRLRLPGLTDAWTAAAEHSNSSKTDNTKTTSSSAAGAAAPKPEAPNPEAPNPQGFTCHAPGNTYQPRRQVPERIDYIWSNAACVHAELALQMSPGGMSYSDHFAVRAQLVPAGTMNQKGSDAAAAGGADGVSGADDVISTRSGGKRAAGAGAMKLGPAAAAAAAAGDGISKQQQQQQQCGVEGVSMGIPQQVATALAAEFLLVEGTRNFAANSGVMTALGGFALTSLVYVAVGLPLLLPEFVLRGVWMAVVILMVAVVACLGTVWLLIGQVGDKSQKRALQTSYRLLRVWMQEQGLVPVIEAADAVAADGVAGDAQQ